MYITVPVLASSSAIVAAGYMFPSSQNLLAAFAQYILSPAIIGVILVWGLNKIFKLGEMKQIFQTIQADVKDLKIKSGSLVNNITVIKTHLVDKAGVNASLFEAMSPISLTSSGNKLIREVGFDDFVKENYEEISQYFLVNGVDTLLKLDEISEVVVTELFTNKRLPSYENEAFTRGISLEVLLRACSLYLRDFIAKKLSIKQ